MNNQSYLTFRSQSLIYGIETYLVREIFQLPELTIIPETPGDIIGVLYLRDHTVPIMHLDRRLGQPVRECKLSDQIILIQWETIEIGIIVSEVLDVVDVDHRLMESEPDYGRENHLNTAFIANIAKIAEQSIILINSEALIRQPETVAEIVADIEEDQVFNSSDKSPLLSNFFDLYCSNTSNSDRAIFRQRAKELAVPLDGEEATGTMPMAIFTMGEEYFSCDLVVVKEFIDLERVYPIPCCPSHIVGNINLRGEIITLVDIRSLLNLTETDRDISHSQAIVVQIDDIYAGIVVDEVFDVLRLAQEQLTPTPSGIAAEIKSYFHGMATYENHLVSALNLPKIFAEGNLVVS